MSERTAWLVAILVLLAGVALYRPQIVIPPSGSGHGAYAVAGPRRLLPLP